MIHKYASTTPDSRSFPFDVYLSLYCRALTACTSVHINIWFRCPLHHTHIDSWLHVYYENHNRYSSKRDPVVRNTRNYQYFCISLRILEGVIVIYNTSSKRLNCLHNSSISTKLCNDNLHPSPPLKKIQEQKTYTV